MWQETVSLPLWDGSEKPAGGLHIMGMRTQRLKALEDT